MNGPVSALDAWVPVCRLDRLEPERGQAALLPGGEQVALFRLHDGRVRAVQNLDPFSGVCVMSRGIVGTRRDRDVVASPMHKQSFDLSTGACLDAGGDAGENALTVYPVRVRAGVVEVRVPDPV
jgi:nitrite reductase (NADH) small subunit